MIVGKVSLGSNSLTADPMEGHLFVVGQDQYPSMGRFRKPPLVAMEDPGSSWWRDEISPHEKRDKQRACAYVSKGACKLNNQ